MNIQFDMLEYYIAHQLNSIGTSAVPVVIKANDLGAPKTVVVEKSAKSQTNLRFLRCRYLACRVRRIGVLGLVLKMTFTNMEHVIRAKDTDLDANSIRSYPLCEKPLHCFK